MNWLPRKTTNGVWHRYQHSYVVSKIRSDERGGTIVAEDTEKNLRRNNEHANDQQYPLPSSLSSGGKFAEKVMSSCSRLSVWTSRASTLMGVVLKGVTIETKDLSRSPSSGQLHGSRFKVVKAVGGAKALWGSDYLAGSSRIGRATASSKGDNCIIDLVVAQDNRRLTIERSRVKLALNRTVRSSSVHYHFQKK